MQTANKDKDKSSGFITIARILGPQGRHGEVAAELHTDFPEQFANRKPLYALAGDGNRHELELESHWPHKGGMVLKFRGIDSISHAEQLIGCEIQIPLAQRTQLQAGEIYVNELIGCRLFAVSRTAAAQEVGIIEDVQFGAGEAPLLVVKQGARELLIPFAQEFLEKIDLSAKSIEVALPEGMLQLDAPLTEEEKKP